MKIVITGAAGQLGREWYLFLADKQDQTEGFGSDELDITDRAAVESILGQSGPDIVINCAAFTDVDGAEDRPDNAYKVNETGVMNLAEWCFENKAKLIHYSTDYVFSGHPGDRELYPGGYPEHADRSPRSVYGASKLAGEQALLESGADFLLIRVSWLCGRYGHNFVKTMLRLATERSTLSVVNDQYGAPSFTDNVVFNTHLLVSKGETGIWHISSKGLISWFEFASKIFELEGLRVDLKPVSSRQFVQKAVRPGFSKLSTGKIEKLNRSRLEQWDQGLERLLADIQSA